MVKRHYMQLRRTVEDAGMNQTELSERSSICYATLSKRMRTPPYKNGSWTACEIMAVCKAADIPVSRIGELFFAGY